MLLLRRELVKMADDRWTSWQAEMAGTSPLPGIVQALALFAGIALVLVALLAGPQATADGGVPVRQQVDSPACAERDRLAGHGVTSGPSYRRAAAACARSAVR
jgi:hypothetical protein